MLVVLVRKPWNARGLTQFISPSQQDQSAFLVGECFPPRGDLKRGHLGPPPFYGSALLSFFIQVAAMREGRRSVREVFMDQAAKPNGSLLSTCQQAELRTVPAVPVRHRGWALVRGSLGYGGIARTLPSFYVVGPGKLRATVVWFRHVHGFEIWLQSLLDVWK